MFPEQPAIELYIIIPARDAYCERIGSLQERNFHQLRKSGPRQGPASTCSRATTSMCPSVTGKVSGNAMARSAPIQMRWRSTAQMGTNLKAPLIR